jgi:predicted transcriptional regulator
MNKDFYTVKDIAEELQVTEKALRHQIKGGKLIASKVLGKYVVSAENYKKYIDANVIIAAETENNQ